MIAKTTLGLFLIIAIHTVSANDSPSYQFDVSTPRINKSAFENPSNHQPKQSDFLIDEYYPMSSLDGDRAVLVKISNDRTGSRHFEGEHVMAVFANGKRARAYTEKQIKFESKESKTLTLEFGHYPYPIVAVYTYMQQD